MFSRTCSFALEKPLARLRHPMGYTMVCAAASSNFGAVRLMGSLFQVMLFARTSLLSLLLLPALLWVSVMVSCRPSADQGCSHHKCKKRNTSFAFIFFFPSSPFQRRPAKQKVVFEHLIPIRANVEMLMFSTELQF